MLKKYKAKHRDFCVLLDTKTALVVVELQGRTVTCNTTDKVHVVHYDRRGGVIGAGSEKLYNSYIGEDYMAFAMGYLAMAENAEFEEYAVEEYYRYYDAPDIQQCDVETIPTYWGWSRPDVY